jgi:plastocyanin
MGLITSRFSICDTDSCFYVKKTASWAVNLITRQIQSYFMKTYIGVIILAMLLVAASGCTTQQAKPVVTTTAVATTAAATEVPTVLVTPKLTATPTEVLTTIAIPVATANVSATATPWSSATFSPVRKLVIHIKDNKYDPDSLAILPGTMVTWINDDSRIHVVKATGDSAGKFTSAELVNGAQFNYDFGEAIGTFEFGDPAYPDMKGAIIVRNGDTLYEAGHKTTTNP